MRVHQASSEQTRHSGKRRPTSPLEVLKRIRADAPNVDKDDNLYELENQILQYDDLNRVIIHQWGSLYYTQCSPPGANDNNVRHRREKQKTVKRQMVNSIKSQLIQLWLPCTRKQIAAHSALGVKIAKHPKWNTVKPNAKFGEVFTERERTQF